MFNRIREALRGRKFYTILGLFVVYKLGGTEMLSEVARAFLEPGEQRQEVLELLFGAGGLAAARAGLDNAISAGIQRLGAIVGPDVAREVALRHLGPNGGSTRPSPVAGDLADHELDRGGTE